MNGKQLKNSILQWAIQGKLVPQDPNDEPASVLLEQIRAEKACLIKEKKIKKDKNESFIFRGDDNSYYEKFDNGMAKCIDDEIPFELPNGWEWCRFSSIYWLLTDGTHSTPKYTTSGIPFLSVKDMSTGCLNFHQTKYISEEDHNALSTRCNPQKGDLLLSKVGTTGVPVIIDTDEKFSIFVSLALIKFFNDKIDSSFLIYLINSPLVQDQAKSNTRGVGNKNWVLSAIANTLLAIPPLMEQRRIAMKLNLLMPMVEKYAVSQNKLDKLNHNINNDLRKSILQEAIQGKLVPQIASEGDATSLLRQIEQEKHKLFQEGKLKKKDLLSSTIYRGDDNKYFEKIGDYVKEITEDIPFEIPVSWNWVRVGHIFQHCTGKALNSSNCKGTLLPYITTSNLYWNKFELDNLRSMYFTDEEIEKCTAKKGDLLVCEGGDIGRAAIWNYDYDICIQNHIHKLRFYYEMNVDYFYYVFFYYKQTGFIGGKGIGIQGLSSGALDKILFPLPPIIEQDRIVFEISKALDKL